MVTGIGLEQARAMPAGTTARRFGTALTGARGTTRAPEPAMGPAVRRNKLVTVAVVAKRIGLA